MYGCSGGGTTTAYTAAIDPRIKAACSACYMTTFALEYTLKGALPVHAYIWQAAFHAIARQKVVY